MGTSQRSFKTKRHRYNISYKMLHLCHLLFACVGLAAAAPSSNYHGHGIQCRTEYTTLWDTEYEDIETHECVTKWVPVCKTYTETECSTENKKVCEKSWEGEGENMKWVDIPGTCEYQPHDECKDVTKEQSPRTPRRCVRINTRGSLLGSVRGSPRRSATTMMDMPTRSLSLSMMSMRS